VYHESFLRCQCSGLESGFQGSCGCCCEEISLSCVQTTDIQPYGLDIQLPSVHDLLHAGRPYIDGKKPAAWPSTRSRTSTRASSCMRIVFNRTPRLLVARCGLPRCRRHVAEAQIPAGRTTLAIISYTQHRRRFSHLSSERTAYNLIYA
jgi:hypothetical protein